MTDIPWKLSAVAYDADADTEFRIYPSPANNHFVLRIARRGDNAQLLLAGCATLDAAERRAESWRADHAAPDAPPTGDGR